MRKSSTLAVLGAALTLAACSTAPERRYGRFIEPAANIGKVVATELAFARAAQQDGQWTAFAEYAADGALLFGRSGAIEARPWLKDQEDPAEAVAWEPHRVWSSCDGSVAVTQGAFRAPDGEIGLFNTVWERQRDGEYRYVFDFGVPQADAPAKPEMIAANVAECDVPEGKFTNDKGSALRRSSDDTLVWTFHVSGEGERHYDVWIAGKDGWEQVVDLNVMASRSE